MNYADSLGPPEPIKKKYSEERNAFECPNCGEIFLSVPWEAVCYYCDHVIENDENDENLS